MTGDVMRQPPGRAERRGASPRQPQEERWPELIQVATQVFCEKGYDAASLQDIADRLGLLKGSLYYYIKSKYDLLYTVISEVHRAGLANIESLAAAAGSARQIGEQFGDMIIRGLTAAQKASGR
jgi:AcrR family transcriptional regulator